MVFFLAQDGVLICLIPKFMSPALWTIFLFLIYQNRGHARARKKRKEKKKKRNPVNSWPPHTIPDIILNHLVNSLQQKKPKTFNRHSLPLI